MANILLNTVCILSYTKLNSVHFFYHLCIHTCVSVPFVCDSDLVEE